MGLLPSLFPLSGVLKVSALSSDPQTDQASMGAVLIHTLIVVVDNCFIFCPQRPVADSLLEKVPTAT